jgi:hypothetical protein
MLNNEPVMEMVTWLLHTKVLLNIGGLDILPLANFQSKADLDLAWNALDQCNFTGKIWQNVETLAVLGDQ